MSGGDQLVPLTRPMYSCWAAKLAHGEGYTLFLATFTFGTFVIGDLCNDGQEDASKDLLYY